MLNALQINKKDYTLSTFPSSNRRNFEDSGIVLAVSVSQFYQSICGSALTAQAYKMVTTTECIQIDNCFCKAAITRCDLSSRFFRVDAMLLCEFESDKI